MTNKFWRACAVFACASTLAFAQNYGSIGGSVKDESGAVVPNASVSVANTETGVVNHVTSLGDGRYQFTSLQPGNYSVSAELQGFKKWTTSGVTPSRVG